MRNLYYVAIEGPIGVGKTSLANLLAEKLGARKVLEDFEDNPFLADFYEEPERFAFQTQLFLSFMVFSPKIVFLNYKLTFVFSKKI